MGILHTALRRGRVGFVSWVLVADFLRWISLAGGDDVVHLRLDPPDAAEIYSALGRYRASVGRISARLVESAGAGGAWIVSQRRARDCEPAARNRHGYRAAVLLVLLLPARAPEKFFGLHATRGLSGNVGGAADLRRDAESVRGHAGDCRALPGTDSANAARRCDGDGAV